jgi:hypothetical protein
MPVYLTNNSRLTKRPQTDPTRHIAYACWAFGGGSRRDQAQIVECNNRRGENYVGLALDVSDPLAITGLSMAAQAQPVTDPTEVAKAMNLLLTRYPEYAAPDAAARGTRRLELLVARPLQSNPTEKDLAKGGASRSRKLRPVISTLRHRSAAATEISVQRSVRAGSAEYDRFRRTIPVLGRLGPGFGRRAWKPAPPSHTRPPRCRTRRCSGRGFHRASGGRRKKMNLLA